MTRIPHNEISIEMDGLSQNEGFARVAVSAFASQVDPLVSDIVDIKTAVSEAVTNAILHGYENKRGKVYIKCMLDVPPAGAVLTVSIRDEGVGIADIAQARTPLYTSKPDMERSGMGFTVMESFMDSVTVQSESGAGTTVTMTKNLSRPE